MSARLLDSTLSTFVAYTYIYLDIRSVSVHDSSVLRPDNRLLPSSFTGRRERTGRYKRCSALLGM